MDVFKDETFYRFIMRSISFDLWILLKARHLMKFLIKLLSSLMQIFAIMVLGAGILLAYTLAPVKINISMYPEERIYTGINPNLRIDKPDYSSHLQRELANLKNQALHIEMNLRKMKNQYKDLSNIARSNHKDRDLADFAAETTGGSVLDIPDTESYYEPSNQQMTFFGIPIWKANYFTPRKVIQPWTEPGECWAFKGSKGKIMIKLAYPTLIDRVTLEHISAFASLTGSINSAPQNFVLYVFIEGKFLSLDSFTYDINGTPSQTFTLKNKKIKLNPVQTILLEIQSNWGHPDYTCIYRFRVHGKIADTGKKDGDFRYIDEKN